MTHLAADDSFAHRFAGSPSREVAIVPGRTVEVLRGVQAILPMHQSLVDLCARCGQTGAMDYLEYFLTSLDSLKKIPHLVLFRSIGDGGAWNSRELRAAVLLYEYRVLGQGSRMFATDDVTADRTVIAPPERRAEVSAEAARTLMGQGATVVLISFQSRLEQISTPRLLQPSTPGRRWLWAMHGRGFARSLPLGATFEETLKFLGHNTRRNMKRYRHRAEANLGASFVADASVSEAEFKAMNASSRDPVSEEQVSWRYRMMLKIPGMFVSGVRGAAGEWLSLIGGQRHHGETEITWQMNRDGFPAYALSTVMRSFLIEHEVALGTTRLLFEGGTPHSVRHSFLQEHAVDLIALRDWTPARVLRRTAKYLLPENNFLAQTLSDTQLEWHRW